MNEVIADSTVAISIYNALVTIGGPSSHRNLFLTTVKMAHKDLNRKQFEAALIALIALKLVMFNGPMIVSMDQKRRLIVSRNRSDMTKQPDGTITGGWNDWTWRDPNNVVTKVFRDRKGTKR